MNDWVEFVIIWLCVVGKKGLFSEGRRQGEDCFLFFKEVNSDLIEKHKLLGKALS